MRIYYHSKPGGDKSATRPSRNGAIMYTLSPAARGRASAVASAPAGANSCASAVRAGP